VKQLPYVVRRITDVDTLHASRKTHKAAIAAYRKVSLRLGGTGIFIISHGVLVLGIYYNGFLVWNPLPEMTMHRDAVTEARKMKGS
jgi:hypothetical protein